MIYSQNRYIATIAIVRVFVNLVFFWDLNRMMALNMPPGSHLNARNNLNGRQFPWFKMNQKGTNQKIFQNIKVTLSKEKNCNPYYI